jgi:hypothetical protein
MLLLQGVADEGMFFAAAQTLAQGLSQWSLLIVAGSLVIIVSPSYYRRVTREYGQPIPVHSRLVIPGDIDHEGIRVQRSYVAYLVGSRQGASVADFYPGRGG